MILQIPRDVEFIIRRLGEHGYEAYAVGGCVRDALLNKEPNDWDITTSALPEQVKAIFSHTIDTGLQHGTVTIMLNHVGYEVTTYRVDGEYEDGRHPKEVTFTASLEEDLKRRDFTINAMAYHPDTGIVDLFHGVEDLEKKVIRCVGNPLDRFTEDALRIMRAMRFSAQLGFTIEENTYHAISALVPNLKKVSAERIRVEMEKTLISAHPEYIRIAYDTGMTSVILPELDVCMKCEQRTPHHCYTVGEHILHSLPEVPADKVLRLTMLLHDIGKPVVRTTDENGRDHFIAHGPASEEIAVRVLRRLKYDNDTIDKVRRLVRFHDYRPEPTPKAVRRFLNQLGADLYPFYARVRKADILAQSLYYREEKMAHADAVDALFHDIMEKEECISLKSLAVNGSDLIACGYQKGKGIGAALKLLLDYVIDHPEANQKEQLLSLLPELEKAGENHV